MDHFHAAACAVLLEAQRTTLENIRQNSKWKVPAPYLVVNRQYFGTGPLATLYGFEMMGALSGHAIATILGGLAIFITGSFNPALVLSMFFSFSGVLVIYSMESSAKVLIPDWEEALPPEAKTTPQISERAVRAALIEQLDSD